MALRVVRDNEGTCSKYGHPLFEVWRSIIRLHSAKNGVTEGWLEFENFVEDVKDHPGKDYRFHKKDNYKPYGPNNYRWRYKYVSTEKSRENRKLYMRKWKAKKKEVEPDYEHDVSLRKSFGITKEHYKDMLFAQNGVCAICHCPETAIHRKTGKTMRLNVDHCHKTGKIRGLLCGKCNTGLGVFKDSPENLISAAMYLEESMR